MAHSAMTETMMSPELLTQIEPEWVSPFVLWLASDSCSVTGNIYSVGGGRVARVAILEAEGVRFDEVPTLAQIAAAQSRFDSLDGATEPRRLADQIKLVIPSL
jgi:hypothetical protein